MTESRPGQAGAVRGLYRAHLAVLAFWLASPFVIVHRDAQDGAAFVAAAQRLLADDPVSVFVARNPGPPFDEAPGADREAFGRFARTYCENLVERDCESTFASFLSPPPALLVYLPAAEAGGDTGMLLVRILAAAPTALAMELLWRALRPRTVPAARLLVVATTLTTPLAVNLVTLGQNTGVVFLAGVLGLRVVSARTDVALGASLAAAVVMKLFPALVLVHLGIRRRWRVLAITGAVLGAWSLITWLTLPRSLWAGFAEVLGVYRHDAYVLTHNRSFDALLQSTVLPDLRVGAVAAAASLVVRLALVIGLWARYVRRGGERLQGAWWWLAALLLGDFLWPHYLLLLLPAAAAVALERPGALVTVPLAAGGGALALATWSVELPGQVVCTVLVLGALIGVALASVGPGPDPARRWPRRVKLRRRAVGIDG